MKSQKNTFSRQKPTLPFQVRRWKIIANYPFNKLNLFFFATISQPTETFITQTRFVQNYISTNFCCCYFALNVIFFSFFVAPLFSSFPLVCLPFFSFLFLFVYQSLFCFDCLFVSCVFLFVYLSLFCFCLPTCLFFVSVCLFVSFLYMFVYLPVCINLYLSFFFFSFCTSIYL